MIAKQLQFWNTISMVPQGDNIVPQFLCAVNHMQITCYEGYFGILSRHLRAIYLQTEGRPVTHRRHEPKWILGNLQATWWDLWQSPLRLQVYPQSLTCQGRGAGGARGGLAQVSPG
eukprot:jgi/Botrbrau1/15360/Bobra.0304s0004.1